MPSSQQLIKLSCISDAAFITVFDAEIVDQRLGQATLRISGSNAEELFANEFGGHRIQRLSGGRVYQRTASNHKGKVHTSTVTVAVLPLAEQQDTAIPERDLEYSMSRGSGAGGQHRNKTESAVQIKHIPTGQIVRIESDRSQHKNKLLALEVLQARLSHQQVAEQNRQTSISRKQQMGRGERADKRRTVRFQDGNVVDHVTGQRWRLKEYLRGEW